jgi:hypothetical protein
VVACWSAKSVKVESHSAGGGTCSLTVKESLLSWKVFRQLLGLKPGQTEPKPATLAAVTAGNGSLK